MKPTARFLLSRSYAVLDEVQKVSTMLVNLRDDHFDAFEQTSELLEIATDNLVECENAIKMYLDDPSFWKKALKESETRNA